MAKQPAETPATPATGITTTLLLLSLLSACGGGSSNGGSGGTGSASLDPLVEDFGIAYVRQFLPAMDSDTDMDPEDIREPTRFNERSDLIFRDLASPGASERNVTFSVTGGFGDVKDVEASFDGSKLLFALRLPEIEGAAPEDQPTWNIWEYDIAADALNRIITSDINAEAGQDVSPHYLPDGRIIFSSTRQRTAKATLLDESKPQFSALDENRNTPALVLHVMNDDGTDIHQVTYNQSHDLDPVVLENGEVVFSRWDNMGNNDAIHLYKMYPDGTNLRLLYGADSHDTGGSGTAVQFLQPRELPHGGIAALLKPFSGNFQGGDIISIDVDNYVNNTQPTAINTGILNGPAQASLAFNAVNTDEPSPGGRFNAFYPLWDGTDRALVSWNQCRLLDNTRIVPCTSETLNNPNLVEANPLYGVYLYDMGNQTLIPVFAPLEGILYRDVVAAQPRRLPIIHFDGGGIPNESFDFDSTLVGENVGILHIRSVHDFDGTYNALGASAADIATLADPQQTAASDRPARFLRIVKAVSIPDDDVLDLNGAAFGVSAQQGMREIIGYAPIEPDGSVRVMVPANIPFTISVLDENGKRISARHQNWLQLRPGEIMNCGGCHDPANATSHGRFDAFNTLNAGAPVDGYIFPNTETFFADPGETMAEARTRIDPTSLEPGVDIHYKDVWTNETAAGRMKDTAFDYNYADLDPTLTAPASVACQSNWDTLCRIVINYQDHIHPLWNVTRDLGGVDKTCTSCHNNRDGAGADMEPAGQLDLSDGVSDINPDHFKSYRELFSGDDAEILDAGGTLIKQQAVDPLTGTPLFALDANGDPDPLQPIFVRAPGPSMRVAGAIASSRFFSRFENPGDADHFGTLSGAELKLIAEWLDIGGQYYNNPFDVPP